jgi:hypothetical protein
MIYSYKGYKIDNNKALILLNLQQRDRCTQYKRNGTWERDGTRVRFTAHFGAHKRKGKHCILMNKCVPTLCPV